MKKTLFIAFVLITSLAIVIPTMARLGDNSTSLIAHYGKHFAIEDSTDDIPTNKGVYIELTEAFVTNVSIIASTNDNYNLNLVETLQRQSFTTNGLHITAYVGNPGENFNGVDFSGQSVREVINCPLTWQTNSHQDQHGWFLFFPPAAIDKFLADNGGNSEWSGSWHSLTSSPGIFIKRTADKSRLAIAYGTSTNEIHRLEFRMMDQNGQTAE